MNGEQTSYDALAVGGVMPPMITPLKTDRTIDVESIGRLLDSFVAAGCCGVLVLGSTGEGPQLDAQQREQVVGAAASSDIGLVLANVPALSTVQAALYARQAVDAGADFILAPPPSGFPLSPDELRRHYESVAAAAEGPVLAYHVPSRIPSALNPELLGLLVKEGVLLGVKDSSGDMDNHRREIMAMRDSGGVGYTGSETCIDMAIGAGFVGSIPGLANVYPEKEVTLVNALKDGYLDEARGLQEELVEYCNLYFGPSGRGSFTAAAVGALKYALVVGGIIDSATMSYPFAEIEQPLKTHVESHVGKFPVS